MSHAVWALATATAGDVPTVHAKRGGDDRSGPEAVLVDRLLTLATYESLPPLSVSLPSWTNGLLAPDALIDRLGRAATDGWEPPPGELEQALLRLDLPEGAADSEVLSLTFAGLGTAAGRTVSDWITGKVRPAAEWPDGIWAGLSAADDGRYWIPEDFRSPLCWPAIAPRHRDVIAAHCAHSLSSEMDSSGRLTEVLPVLAEVDGPMGEPTALALAYGLCAGRPEQRAFAQRGLVLMCARPEWDGATFGRVFGELLVRRSVVLKRAVEPLRNAASDGASTALWPALREAVLAMLAGPQPQPGLGDLLALAAELAQQTSATDQIPGLSEFAARPGTSRQLVEARRLQAVLNR